MLDTKGNLITYIGHSTFTLTSKSGQVAMIDPWVASNPACPEGLKKTPKLDVVFVTHGHTDHIGDLLTLCKEHKPHVLAIFETCKWLDEKKTGAQTVPMGKGGTQKAGEFEGTLTHAQHSNSIDDNGERIYGGEPGGFVIRMPGGFTIFHAGDTSLFGDMRLIGELYKPDLVMLPIGDKFTMGPREAGYAVRFLGAKHVIPMHYATFPALTGTVDAFRSEVNDSSVEIHAMKPGDRL